MGTSSVTVALTPRQRAEPGVGLRDAPRAEPGPRLDLRGVAVLVVEDDADSLDFLGQMVGAFGATVLTARDGREAIELVSRTAPDLVLCDLLMPHVNGFQFMNWLRDQPHLSRIPVIAVTALGGQTDIMRTWEAGFNAHLVKPIDYDMLRRQLERLLWAHHNPD
jgi:CheY-like chemotaxis protein